MTRFVLSADGAVRAMAAIGLGVGVSSAVLPAQFLRVFGVAEDDNGSSRLAWRLFAGRTAAVSVLALRGDQTARDLFLPLQMADQAAWWWGYRRGEVPLRTAGLAAAASGAIVVLDLRRRLG